MTDLNLSVIGNCSFSALIDRTGRIVWCCMPRFDGDPVFCTLLNDGKAAGFQGFYDIEVENFTHSEQQYLHNSAILVTTIYDSAGNAMQLIDFAPRFKQFDRMFRPITLVRQIRPLIGMPRIRVRLRPMHDYGGGIPATTHGSNHIRYVAPSLVLRLTTDIPVSFVLDETAFLLDRPHNLMLGPDEPVTRSIADTTRDFYEKTLEYWREWSRYLSVPFEWQEAVIRSAISLKLCSFEESGAIIAAPTTSVPEASHTERNWDYRYCWLRDAYFVVHALNRLGATRTMEGFLTYILNVVAGAKNGHIQPVYGIALEAALDERLIDTLAGYRGMGPVRVGNMAYKQIQNDVYGSVILATTQAFFDQRIDHPGDHALFERLEKLGELAAKHFDQPDAGLWELRNSARVHTFSSLMCWAACDRLAKIALQLGIRNRADSWRDQADRIRTVILNEAWNDQISSFVSSFGGSDVDASLLLMHEFGFIAADDKRFVSTVTAIEKALKRGNYIFRYAVADDFGHPENAFNICTFWYIDALAAIGRVDEARSLFENMLSRRNHVGLLSEDLDPATEELWGNFPQTYSMVGLINSAMRLSKTWEEAF